MPLELPAALSHKAAAWVRIHPEGLLHAFDMVSYARCAASGSMLQPSDQSCTRPLMRSTSCSVLRSAACSGGRYDCCRSIGSASYGVIGRIVFSAARRRMCSDKIEAITGVRPTLFRCPYGEYNDTAIKAIRSLGVEPVQWDVDSLDWKGLSAGADIDQTRGDAAPRAWFVF